jgi:hypothetical protein
LHLAGKLSRPIHEGLPDFPQPAGLCYLYSTVSRPFDKPADGKIAVKVINHYGDEVLKVFEV